jgi:hypothetical protein
MATPPMQALTHHEILGLIEPYTRRGRHVDLPASDRLARRLEFRALDHSATADGPALRETLTLDNPAPGQWRLVRRLTAPSGQQASLQAEGAVPGALLERIEAVPLGRGFLRGEGFEIALCQRLPPLRAQGPAAPPAPVLHSATLRLAGLQVDWSALPVAGAPAELRLRPLDATQGSQDSAPIGRDQAGCRAGLPEDLLAVLGRDWSLLRWRDAAWQAEQRLPRREPARSRAAEAGLLRAAGHLAQTLAESPARFHPRWRRARWQVTLRRATPVLVCGALILASPALASLALAQTSVVRMFVFNAPPLLLVLFFGLREVPRFEIPPWPRPFSAPAWLQAAPAEAA